jgi:hypothetical protein
LWTLYATNTSHRRQETFLYEYPLHWVRLPTKKRTTERFCTVVHPQAWLPFLLLKPASKHAHEVLLPTLSWSWTVLLPSDTYRKPVTSTIAVLLPFVTYLLALHRILTSPAMPSNRFLSCTLWNDTSRPMFDAVSREEQAKPSIVNIHHYIVYYTSQTEIKAPVLTEETSSRAPATHTRKKNQYPCAIP